MTPTWTRLADRLGAISDLSARYGLRAVLEFFPWTVVPDLGTAVQVVEAAGRTQTGILVIRRTSTAQAAGSNNSTAYQPRAYPSSTSATRR